MGGIHLRGAVAPASAALLPSFSVPRSGALPGIPVGKS